MTFSFLLVAAAAAAQAAAPQGHVDPAQAQAAGYAQAQAALNPSAAQSVTVPQANPAAARFLPAGSIVSLTPLEELSSKHIKEGQRYQFIVVNDVVDHGVVVIPRGSPATGIVTMKTGRAIGGKSGKFDVTFESVAANGVTFPLSGVFHQEGKGNTLGALFGSIWISGHSAVMQPGQVATAFVKAATAY